MGMTQGQIEFYEENGYLIFEDLFTHKEIDVLLDEVPKLCGEKSDRIIKEKSGAVRTIFAAHEYSEIMKSLICMPQLLEIAKTLLGSEVYVHQFKINAKLALEGDQWEWHQDFLYWNKEDAMPSSRVLTIAIFLNDIHEFNGPMLIIPKSHKEGMLDVNAVDKFVQNKTNGTPNWMSTLTADLKYKINRDILSYLLKKSEIMSVKGRAGLTLCFHGNLFHASSQNLSEIDRQSIFISYNSVENKLDQKENPRPEFIASRNFTPIKPTFKNALLEVTRR